MTLPVSSTLVLGGARSGKSSYAQSLAESARSSQVYIATAQALDAEMTERIARHVEDRGPSWSTIEAPLEIGRAINQASTAQTAVLVDCLTLWLSNLMHSEVEVEQETARLISALQEAEGPIFLVSNEVGLGIVPENALARDFRDAQGRLNQALAGVCERVEFLAAGLPLRLKG